MTFNDFVAQNSLIAELVDIVEWQQHVIDIFVEQPDQEFFPFTPATFNSEDILIDFQ